MVLITIREIIDIIIMSFFIGFLLSDVFKRFQPRKEYYDPLAVRERQKFGIDWNSLKFSTLVTAPAIVLHELGHKFVAMGFGLNATFNAFYANSTTLFLGIVALLMKFMNFGFIFIVPGYVEISELGTNPLQMAIIAFAGPAVNLILWLVSALILKKKLVDKKYLPFVYLTSKINMFLFIFNMLPFFFFDGYKVFSGLWQAFFG
jgi:Zn-dependent protease